MYCSNKKLSQGLVYAISTCQVIKQSILYMIEGTVVKNVRNIKQIEVAITGDLDETHMKQTY